MNEFVLLLCDVFSFVFWKKLKTPKRLFEINWPLEHPKISGLIMKGNLMLMYCDLLTKLNSSPVATACNFEIHTFWNIILERIRKQGRKILQQCYSFSNHSPGHCQTVTGQLYGQTHDNFEVFTTFGTNKQKCKQKE